MKLVVFSDLHLDAPFAWARPDAARALRQALRETLLRVVELARDRGADALLCAGDLYEHERASVDTAELLRHAFASAPCPVVIAPGNHDPYVHDSLYARTAWPANVHVFRAPELTPLALSERVTLWGAAHVHPRGTASFFEAGFRADGPGLHLGLFHGSEQGFLAFEGATKEAHAPFSAGDIAASGLLHAFVGHYHTPRSELTFTYPGAPGFLTFGAPAGGAVVAEISPRGAIDREVCAVACIEAHDLEIDVSGLPAVEAIRELVAAELAGRRGVARVTLVGELPSALDFRPRQDLALEALGGGADGLLDLRVRADGLFRVLDVGAIAGEPTVRGEFVRRVLAAAELDETTRRQVLAAGLRALEGRDDLEVVP